MKVQIVTTALDGWVDGGGGQWRSTERYSLMAVDKTLSSYSLLITQSNGSGWFSVVLTGGARGRRENGESEWI